VQDVRLSPKLVVALLTAACISAAPSAAQAFSPYLVVPDPAVAEASPAYHYANMTDAQALAELDRRGVRYTKLEQVPGVRAPIRLSGRLHGVLVHSALPENQRATSPFEILDARLALALDDFCALLSRHGVDEIVHFSMYRPNVTAPVRALPGAAPAPVSDGKPEGARPRTGASTRERAAPSSAGPRARPNDEAQGTRRHAPHKGAAPKSYAPPRARPGESVPGSRLARRDPAATRLYTTTWAPPATRHPAGLAIDVAMLHERDGRWLTVRSDFHGRIGVKTCGEGARVPDGEAARELHAIVCEARDPAIFTYVLTPDFNAAHADHFHMEIKPGVRWFLYH